MGASMRDPVGILAASLHHAVLVGLNPERYPIVTYEGTKVIKTDRIGERRPHIDNVDCTMFTQVWGSTSLGFGGIGGQAMTTAYTVVVHGSMGDACVYFNGRFAYRIDRPNDLFRTDVLEYRMSKVAGAAALYESHR